MRVYANYPYRVNVESVADGFVVAFHDWLERVYEDAYAIADMSVSLWEAPDVVDGGKDVADIVGAGPVAMVDHASDCLRDGMGR
ncbi:hypothetical protein [Bifidobacterium magnum]|uniref:hypothetical protein n=1 Tax=Bifidobacterium magnum TaxID=1692 RepID=UPI00126A2023|nr:hypothetical protein [Bifidobacterium magnum]